jgi:CRISPR-associated protein Csh2
MTNTDYDPVTNRSEIVFAYDAVDANPNGNPLSASNRPRIDPETGEAIVTDVRFKRYLRDQLDDDNHGVYITNPNEGSAPSRDDLIKDVVGPELKEELRETDSDEYGPEVMHSILDNAVDIRMFGATLSLEADSDLAEKINDALPSQFTGPIQFSPAKSLNAPVEENENYNSLTSVISTGDDNEQGGFDLDDHRLKYALFPFHGIVNEHGAADTRLREADVKRLDTLCWRAIKNQTTTRSKTGQEPRFYLRVEYSEDSFHLGDLHADLTLDDEQSAPPAEMRAVDDVTLDATSLVDRLLSHGERIETVHVVASDRLDVTVDDETVSGDEFADVLTGRLGDEAVHEVGVYEEYPETLPDE